MGIEAGETLDLSRRLRGFLQMMLMTRRNLVSGVAGLAASAALRGATARMPLGANVILPGVTAIYTIAGQAGYRETDDPAVLAQEHKRFGYTAAFCPDGSPGDSARVNAIRKAFADAGVLMAEVGAWRNMMTPDPEARKANIEYVARQLELADALGVKCCVDIAGSFDGTTLSGPHPKNLSKEFFDGTVENCRKIVDAVKPRVAKFAIEMKAWDIPDGPDSYLDLIRAIEPTYWDGLSDMEACLRSFGAKLYHMGFHGRASRSTLVDANDSHDWRIYAAFV